MAAPTVPQLPPDPFSKVEVALFELPAGKLNMSG
jgi:hypothetical protein